MPKLKPAGAYGTEACPRCETENVLRKAKNGKIYQDCPACGHRSFWGRDESEAHIEAIRGKRAKAAPQKAAKPEQDPKAEVEADGFFID